MQFLEKLDILSIETIRQIELCTRGQCCNEQLYCICRKGVITGSKGHEVILKMKKVRKGGGGVVNIWSLKENSKFWNGICQSKHPSFKTWKRLGN